VPETPASTLAATVSASETPLDSHTSSAQWQSFEMRMCERRAARCVVRAQAALDAGLVEDAREALNEARRLHPASAAIAAAEERLNTCAATSTGSDSPDSSAAAKSVSSDVSDSSSPRRRVMLSAMAAACAILSLAWLMGWRMLSGSPAADVHPGTGHDVVLGALADTAPVQAAGEIAGQARLVQASTALPVSPSEGSSTVAAGDTDPPQIAIDITTALPELLGRLAIEPPAEPRNSPIEPVSMPPPLEAPSISAPAASIPGREIAVLPPPTENPVAHRAGNAASGESAAVRAALARYSAAYSDLDAAAARAVWPAVDERALARAFDGLAAQRVSLGECDVRVTGDAATATCLGSAAWTPKIGGGQRTVSRRWEFDLKNADGAWYISRVQTF
jgi:hypothetical protein